MLALFLPVAAVLYIGGEAVSPRGTDVLIANTATALQVLPIAARHPAQLYLASFLVLLGLGALAVSYGAITTLVKGRGAALATAAALLGGLGAFCGAIVNVVRQAGARFRGHVRRNGRGPVYWTTLKRIRAVAESAGLSR